MKSNEAREDDRYFERQGEAGNAELDKAKCATCNGEGEIVCPRCEGRGMRCIYHEPDGKGGWTGECPPICTVTEDCEGYDYCDCMTGVRDCPACLDFRKTVRVKMIRQP